MSKHKYSKEFLERTGLKLEEINPSKASVKEESEEVQTKSFPNVALGMYSVKDGPGTKYVLVEIPFDPETGDTGYIKEILRDIREDAIDRFKVEVDKQGFFTGEKKSE
jgi:hypothetical protein